MKLPEIEITLNLGDIGLHVAQVGYDSNYGDVQYVIVDDMPLYLELEVTTLSESVQYSIYHLIALDRHERNQAAAEHLADLALEDALLNQAEARAVNNGYGGC